MNLSVGGLTRTEWIHTRVQNTILIGQLHVKHLFNISIIVSLTA